MDSASLPASEHVDAVPSALPVNVVQPTVSRDDQHLSASSRQYVKLNVGGSLFQTTLSTLCNCKCDCMLRAMFSGRLEVLCDEDGYVLIDRCGKHFGSILNFLRQGSCPLSECKVEVEELMQEARYYLIQELAAQCQEWLHYLGRVKSEPSCFPRIPVVTSKTDVEKILRICADRPIIELLMNRQNNKYSYTHQSDENFLRNQELFDKLVLRFNNRVLFIKNVGIGSSEMCLWTFYSNGQKRVEICCTSIVYATDKKQTKVEFPEARIYEEAMNALLTYDQQESKRICPNCHQTEDESSSALSARQQSTTLAPPVPLITRSSLTEGLCPSLQLSLAAATEQLSTAKSNLRQVDWRMDHLTISTPGTGSTQQVVFGDDRPCSSKSSTFLCQAHHDPLQPQFSLPSTSAAAMEAGSTLGIHPIRLQSSTDANQQQTPRSSGSEDPTG